jgi:hypothetical protein
MPSATQDTGTSIVPRTYVSSSPLPTQLNSVPLLLPMQIFMRAQSSYNKTIKFFSNLMDTLPVHSIAFFDHAIWQEELQGLVLCLLPLTLRR